jgi:ArsR family transcriptional regulator
VKNLKLELLECAPGAESSMMARTKAEEFSELLKAVADPTRLQILAMIAKSDQKEACVCNLTGPLSLSQPTISHHLKKLSEVGIIDRERRGTWIWYSLNTERWGQIAKLFS